MLQPAMILMERTFLCKLCIRGRVVTGFPKGTMTLRILDQKPYLNRT